MDLLLRPGVSFLSSLLLLFLSLCCLSDPLSAPLPPCIHALRFTHAHVVCLSLSGLRPPSRSFVLLFYPGSLVFLFSFFYFPIFSPRGKGLTTLFFQIFARFRRGSSRSLEGTFRVRVYVGECFFAMAFLLHAAFRNGTELCWLWNSTLTILHVGEHRIVVNTANSKKFTSYKGEFYTNFKFNSYICSTLVCIWDKYYCL